MPPLKKTIDVQYGVLYSFHYPMYLPLSNVSSYGIRYGTVNDGGREA